MIVENENFLKLGPDSDHRRIFFFKGISGQKKIKKEPIIKQFSKQILPLHASL